MDLSNIENDIDFQMSPKNPIHSDIDNILNLIDNDTDTDTKTMISFIINICNNVFNTLGKGFNECIYHKAILVDLYKTEFNIETEKIIPILFNNICVGHVKTDIIVESDDLLIIIELKALDRDINYKEEIQIKKYIKHINKQKNMMGLIINFSQKNNESLEVQSKIIN